jgi:aminopeptidase N
MGDDRFWAGIRDYYARYRNANASTNDFRLAMERASGLELSAFFKQWLYRGGIPRIEGTWQWDATAKQVVVELTQTQPGEPFVLPVDVGITLTDGKVRVERADLAGHAARFSFACEQEPSGVALDPNLRLLFEGRLARRP